MFHRCHFQAPSVSLRVVAFALLGLAILIPLPADAFGLDDVADGFLKAIGGLFYALGNFAWDLAEAMGRFFTWILVDFNQNVGFRDNLMVQQGWILVRDVANWFFIVILLVSAIATILQIPQEYNARRIMPKLIVVALLVNFSLFFTGFFINVAQAFMTIFVVQGVGPYDDVGQALAHGMRLGDLTGTETGRNEASFADFYRELYDNDDLAEEGLFITLYILRIVFALVAAFTFLFLAIMLVIRVIYLWISMILAPLAFVAMLTPRTQQFWKEWLENFINWTSFGVFAAFFVWLATMLVAYLYDPSGPFTEKSDTLVSSNEKLFILIQSAVALMQFITIILFLWLSVKFSKRFAGEGAKFATAAIATAGAGLAIPAVAGGVSRLRMTRVGASVQGNVGRAMLETRIGRLPGLRTVGRRLTAAEERVRGRERDVGGEVERMEDSNARARWQAAKPREKLAIEKSLERQGRLARVLDLLPDRAGDLSDAQRNTAEGINARERQYEGNRSFAVRSSLAEFLPHSQADLKNPDGTVNMTSEVSMALQRARASDAEKWSASFWNSDVGSHYLANYAETEHVTAVMRNASFAVIDAMVKALRGAMTSGAVAPRLKSALETSPGFRSLGFARASEKHEDEGPNPAGFGERHAGT